LIDADAAATDRAELTGHLDAAGEPFELQPQRIL
jgi:hypothetical protein